MLHPLFLLLIVADTPVDSVPLVPWWDAPLGDQNGLGTTWIPNLDREYTLVLLTLISREVVAGRESD